MALRKQIEEQSSKSLNLQKENEYIKSRIESEVLKRVEEKGMSSSGGGGGGSNGNMEEQIQKKNKEIYELTVQLGCLKEENTSLKKDQDELA